MRMSDPLRIVRILDKRIPYKVVGEVDDIIQAVTNIQLIARQHGKEMFTFRLVHAVHALSKTA